MLEYCSSALRVIYLADIFFRESIVYLYAMTCHVVGNAIIRRFLRSCTPLIYCNRDDLEVGVGSTDSGA